MHYSYGVGVFGRAWTERAEGLAKKAFLGSIPGRATQFDAAEFSTFGRAHPARPGFSGAIRGAALCFCFASASARPPATIWCPSGTLWVVSIASSRPLLRKVGMQSIRQLVV